MEGYEQGTPATGASRRLERTDLLLSQVRTDLRLGRVPEEQPREQRAALALVEAALDTYLGYFQPPASSQ